MRAVLANILDNPILLRELRRRMRGKALIYSINTYIFLMTLSTGVLLLSAPTPFAVANQDMLESMKLTGERIYYWIAGIQALLVLIVAPTITAGMTTGEKERKTFEFLRVTTITRWMYIMGCFLSTAFYVALALLCALPLLSLTFLYGGVTLELVARTFFILLSGSFVLSSFGLFISSVCERTRTAQGIIVFLVFALLFGGFVLQNLVSSLYQGSAAGATAQGASVGNALYIGNVAVPEWIVVASGLILLSGILLLLAARKLFEPDETRSLAHWQFGLLFVSVLAVFIAALAANPAKTEVPEIAFLAVGYSLLLVAVQTFAVGRMEVGDEIWHLKRLMPFLRPFDQSVPFLVAVGLLWYYVMRLMPSSVLTPMLAPAYINSLMLVTLSSYFFFCVVARFMTAISGSRNQAGKRAMLVIGFFLLIAPIGGWFIFWTIPPLDRIGYEIMAFSPFALLIDGFQYQNSAKYSGTSIPVGGIVASVYTILGIGLGIFAEVKRYMRWRHFDYHYDMPAR